MYEGSAKRWENQGRLWDRLIHEPNTGCWLWPGSTSPFGYGVIKWRGRTVKAHRLAYECAKGRIDGGSVCHKCDTPRCCNPDHLYLGTHAQNMADRRAHNRTNFGARAGMAKLDYETAEKIRALKPTHSLRKLAKMFGISDGTVCNIVNRKTYTQPESAWGVRS